LKGRVQILNPLPGKAFRPIRAGIFDFDFTRSNYAPKFADSWPFLTMPKNENAPQILDLQCA
jgi:hypothetical protein